MIAEELHCTVIEAKSRVDPQAFVNQLTYWETNPRLKDHINNCMANVAYTVAATNRSKGQKLVPFPDFLLDYKKAALPGRKKVDTKIRSIMGGLAKKGIKSNG